LKYYFGDIKYMTRGLIEIDVNKLLSTKEQTTLKDVSEYEKSEQLHTLRMTRF